MITGVFWLACGIVAFLLIYRVTASLVVAAAAHFAIFRALRFLSDEVGHPQEVCMLLMLGILLAACAQRQTAAMAWAGALAAAIVMTKVNLGIIVLVALGVVWAQALPPGPLRRAVLPAAWLGAFVMPLVLMSQHLSQPWAYRHALLYLLSLAAVFPQVNRGKPQPLGLRHFGVAALSAFLSAAFFCVFMMAHGSTLWGMFESMVLWSRSRFATGWTIPLELDTAALFLGAVCVWLSWRSERLPDAWIAGMKLVLAAAAALLAAVSGYRVLLEIALPLIWLVLLRPRLRRDQEVAPVRSLLAVMGVLQTLYPYPVAATHTQFACVLPIAISAVCAWDALPWLAERLPIPSRAVAAAVLAIAALYVATGWLSWRQFQGMEPIGLRGAQRTRLPHAQAEAFRRLTAAAKPCSMLVTESGMYSFNLLTGKPGPVTMRSGPWMFLMDDAEQQSAVRELEASPQVCGIFRPDIYNYWSLVHESTRGPLEAYLRDRFRTQFEIDAYQFKVRIAP
jgi:hypothetical protein